MAKKSEEKEVSKSKSSATSEKSGAKKVDKGTTSSKNAKAKAKTTATPVKKETKVKAKSDAAKSLDDLFEDCLKDALPKMIKNATSPKLKEALEAHLEETKEHIKHIKDAFKSIGVKAEEEKCDAMAGILDEGEGILEETAAGAVRDAGIIAACQKVEHYEIASYGTMVAYAQLLGHKEAKTILSGILEQEKKTDVLLSKLATSEINIKADQ